MPSMLNWPELHWNTLWFIWSNITFNLKKYPKKVINESNRTLWIMTTNMHSTAKILKFASMPSMLNWPELPAIYFQSLRMVGESVGYMLKSPFVNLKRIVNIKINCKKDASYGVCWMHVCCQFSWLMSCSFMTIKSKC